MLHVAESDQTDSDYRHLLIQIVIKCPTESLRLIDAHKPGHQQVESILLSRIPDRQKASPGAVVSLILSQLSFYPLLEFQVPTSKFPTCMSPSHVLNLHEISANVFDIGYRSKTLRSALFARIWEIDGDRFSCL